MYRYTLELYKNQSENNDLQKVITDKKQLDAYSRESVDILNPVVDLQGYTVNDYNYCYIQELRRYYYIEKIVSAPNGTTQLSMKVDVLMSFIDDIKASHGLITKQVVFNPYYGENDVDARQTVDKLEFTDQFDHTGEFVVVALRG